MGGIHASVESNVEPHLEDESLDEDLNMPDHIVRRRNEALKRGQEMRQKESRKRKKKKK